MVETYECWFDGACEPKNPGGTATYGIKIERDGKTICEKSGIVGSGPLMSNNVAEYAAISEIFGFLLALQATGTVRIKGDSNLVVEQLNGHWKAKRGLYLEWHKLAKEQLRLLRQSCEVEISWIPREQNDYCDQLSKTALSL